MDRWRVFMASEPSQIETVGERFERLYGDWWKHVQQNMNPYSSSDRDYIENRHFDAMVDLGPDAVPYIMEILRADENAHFLIHALSRITGKEFSHAEIDAFRTPAEHSVGNQTFVRLWLSWWDSQQTK